MLNVFRDMCQVIENKHLPAKTPIRNAMQLGSSFIRKWDLTSGIKEQSSITLKSLK